MKKGIKITEEDRTELLNDLDGYLEKMETMLFDGTSKDDIAHFCGMTTDRQRQMTADAYAMFTPEDLQMAMRILALPILVVIITDAEKNMPREVTDFIREQHTDTMKVIARLAHIRDAIADTLAEGDPLEDDEII